MICWVGGAAVSRLTHTCVHLQRQGVCARCRTFPCARASATNVWLFLLVLVMVSKSVAFRYASAMAPARTGVCAYMSKVVVRVVSRARVANICVRCLVAHCMRTYCEHTMSVYMYAHVRTSGRNHTRFKRTATRGPAWCAPVDIEPHDIHTPNPGVVTSS